MASEAEIIQDTIMALFLYVCECYLSIIEKKLLRFQAYQPCNHLANCAYIIYGNILRQVGYIYGNILHVRYFIHIKNALIFNTKNKQIGS